MKATFFKGDYVFFDFEGGSMSGIVGGFSEPYVMVNYTDVDVEKGVRIRMDKVRHQWEDMRQSLDETQIKVLDWFIKFRQFAVGIVMKEWHEGDFMSKATEIIYDFLQGKYVSDSYNSDVRSMIESNDGITFYHEVMGIADIVDYCHSLCKAQKFAERIEKRLSGTPQEVWFKQTTQK